MAPSPLNMAVVANGQYEQQPQPLQCPVSPVGYMTCGTYQYALVPVPVQQYNNGAGYAVSPTYHGTPQAKSPMEQQQQQWGPYEDYQQHGGCMVSPTHQYHSEQHSPFFPYEAVAVATPVSPCGAAAAGSSNQWW